MPRAGLPTVMLQPLVSRVSVRVWQKLRMHCRLKWVALGEEVLSNMMLASLREPCQHCKALWPAARLWHARAGPCHDDDIFTLRSVTFCALACQKQQYVIPLDRERERKRALKVIMHMIYERAQLRLRECERALIYQRRVEVAAQQRMSSLFVAWRVAITDWATMVLGPRPVDPGHPCAWCARTWEAWQRRRTCGRCDLSWMCKLCYSPSCHACIRGPWTLREGALARMAVRRWRKLVLGRRWARFIKVCCHLAARGLRPV